MIKIAIIVLLSLPSFLLSAQQYELPLWGQEVPNYKASGEKEIVEGETSRRISYVQNPAIEVYLPSKNNSTGQAVVICPGGGYTALLMIKKGLILLNG
jgi:acetyl esterase/lipase